MIKVSQHNVRILPSLLAIRKDADAAVELLKRSDTIPQEVVEFVIGIGRRLFNPFDAYEISEINPYHASGLWRYAYKAASAIHTNDRKHLRIPLEGIRLFLNELIEEAPYSDLANIDDIMELTISQLSVPQTKYAELLGVSPRTLHRWRSGQTKPSHQDAARIRFVGKLVSKLSHYLTKPGVYAWFYHEHTQLKKRPVDLLGDPSNEYYLLSLVEAVRSMPV